MKKSNKLLFCLIALIILIIALVVFMLKYIKKNEAEIIESQIYMIESDDEEHKKNNQLYQDKTSYINITKCLTQYVSELNLRKSTYYGYDEKNNYTMIVDDDTINKNIYNLLSDNYIKKNNIDTKNVRDYIYKIENTCFYTPVEIDVKYSTFELQSYGIYGVIQDINNNPITESYLILNIDKINQTFSIEQLNSYEGMKNFKTDNMQSIAKKENNQYSDIVGLLDEVIIKEYINTYKRLALGYPEIAYNNLLDEQYRNQKFGSVDNFKRYIDDNRKTITGSTIQKYSVEEFDQYIQFIGIDQNNKYYVFNASMINNYKILLDTYTVDIPQFTEKYNEANTIERAGYNIQKCIDAINDKDYMYIYNKLNEEFKENYYKTEESFIKTIKKELYTNNKVEKASNKNEGNNYIYNIIVTNVDNEKEQKNMTIIIKLKENTDFEMSFSFDK